ncbi:hypothetical protein GCM10009780_64050 [Actinomadura alba]
MPIPKPLNAMDPPPNKHITYPANCRDQLPDRRCVTRHWLMNDDCREAAEGMYELVGALDASTVMA